MIALMDTCSPTMSPVVATMNKTPGDRLRELREARGMGVREVARASEGAFGRSYVSSLESGVAAWAKVSLTVIEGFARAFNISVDDLLDYVDGRADAHRADELVTNRQIPLYEMVGAGLPDNGGSLIDHVDIPLDWRGEYTAYVIDGGSMSPKIPEGAQVVVKRTTSAKPGDIIVCYVPDHGMLCKKVHSVEPDGTWVLGSIDPDYPPVFSRDVVIMGVVKQIRIDL